jgi:putative copper export protein
MAVHWLTLAQQKSMPLFDGVYFVNLSSRILHILGAIILVGGLFYIRFVLSPVNAPPGTAPVDSYYGGRRAIWAKWVGASTLLLLLTGLWNYVQIMKMHERLASTYHMIAGLKMIAELVVFLLAALLAGRTAAADALRAKWRMWLNICLFIAIVTVVLGSVLRSFPHHPKIDTIRPTLIAPANTPEAP